MCPERVCSFVVLLKNQRQEYEHTNSDVGNEKTERGVAEEVGSGAARVPPKVKITEWSAGRGVLRKQTIAEDTSTSANCKSPRIEAVNMQERHAVQEIPFDRSPVIHVHEFAGHEPA